MRITTDFYEQKRFEFRAKQDELSNKIEKLQKADEHFYLTTAYLVELASRAGELFKSSEAEEKRQMFTLVLQNLRLEGKRVRYDLLFPFDVVFQHASRSEWLYVIEEMRECFVFNSYMSFSLSECV